MMREKRLNRTKHSNKYFDLFISTHLTFVQFCLLNLVLTSLKYLRKSFDLNTSLGAS